MSDKLDDHAVLVTCDTHVGPRLIEDLRPYCPQAFLADFDEFAEDTRPVREWWLSADAPGSRLSGHYDSAARRRDMEGDGVVAEVLFHFSFNGELLAVLPSFTHSDHPSDPALAVGAGTSGRRGPRPNGRPSPGSRPSTPRPCATPCSPTTSRPTSRCGP